MNNLNLIRKIAWSFHRSTGIDWDDLFQEAVLAYLEAERTHKPDRGKMTTHAWTCITNRLKNYIKEQEDYKSRKHGEELCSIEDTILTRHPAQMASDFWEALSDDAKDIANIVLATPKKFLWIPAEQVHRRIHNILSCRGWCKNRIQNGIFRITTVCQNKFV